jgi:hypothetical protein
MPEDNKRQTRKRVALKYFDYTTTGLRIDKYKGSRINRELIF